MCKGSLFLAADAFVRKRFGAAAVDRCLAGFSAEEQLVWKSAVAVGRYPMALMTRFLRAADAALGKNDLALCHDAGRFAAEYQLTLFHKFALRFTTPHWLMDRGVRIYDVNVGSGRWQVEKVSERELIARLDGFAEPDPALCRRWSGWIQRAAEMTGAKQCTVPETRCRLRGDPLCEYRGTWS